MIEEVGTFVEVSRMCESLDPVPLTLGPGRLVGPRGSSSVGAIARPAALAVQVTGGHEPNKLKQCAACFGDVYRGDGQAVWRIV